MPSHYHWSLALYQHDNQYTTGSTGYTYILLAEFISTCWTIIQSTHIHQVNDLILNVLIFWTLGRWKLKKKYKWNMFWLTPCKYVYNAYNCIMNNYTQYTFCPGNWPYCCSVFAGPDMSQYKYLQGQVVVSLVWGVKGLTQTITGTVALLSVGCGLLGTRNMYLPSRN